MTLNRIYDNVGKILWMLLCRWIESPIQTILQGKDVVKKQETYATQLRMKQNHYNRKYEQTS